MNKWISPQPLLFGAILVGNLLLVHLCCPEREREFCCCHQLRQFPADTLVLTCGNPTTVPTPSVHISMPHSPFPMLFYKMKRLVLLLYYFLLDWGQWSGWNSHSKIAWFPTIILHRFFQWTSIVLLLSSKHITLQCVSKRTGRGNSCHFLPCLTSFLWSLCIVYELGSLSHNHSFLVVNFLSVAL